MSPELPGVCFWGPIKAMSAKSIDLMFGVNAIGSIAQVALFLCSDAARALQGAYVLADQGISSTMSPPAS